MSQALPFANPKPLGWGLYEVLTSAQMTAVNENAANAADGAAWSDAAIVKNWNYTQISGAPTSLTPKALVIDPSSRRWLAFGITSEACFVWTLNGTKWFGPIFLSGSPLLNALGAAWANNAGVILAGGTPAASSASKLRVSSDGGNSWASRSVGNSNTQAVQGITYVESLGLWVASIGGAPAKDGIFTSPDTTTWTNRSSTQCPQFFAIRDTPSTIVLGTNLPNISPDPTQYIRSVDAVTWTLQTFPDSCSNQGCFSNYWGKFFITGLTGIWSSSTGSTGSWTRVNASETTSTNVASFGRLLVKGDGKCSVDGGASWFPVMNTTDTDYFISASAYGVAAVRSASREVFLSQQIGF